MKNKLQHLEKGLLKQKKVIIAFSGGVDSTFLLHVAVNVLGKENVIAVTADSETYTREELKEAKKTARDLRVRHIVVRTQELSNRKFAKNSTERCYFCKKELFSALKSIAQKQHVSVICDASNMDDLSDFRPGAKAAKEFNVKKPLIEAKLSKKDIRGASRKLKLKTWNSPSCACLASRFPYGTRITKEELIRIGKGEAILRKLGFKTIRLRDYGLMVRIEVGVEEMKKFHNQIIREKCVKALKKIGFTYITLDLEGFRSGSMNEAIYLTKR